MYNKYDLRTITIKQLIVMRPVKELCDMLRERGMKITPQRRLIFEVLQDGAEHPTAEDIYHSVRDAMPDISPATVYHALNDLVAMGEVTELDLREGKRRYDPCTDGHYHLVCLNCRGVVDIMRASENPKLLPEEASGYQIVRCDVVFYGYCSGCQG